MNLPSETLAFLLAKYAAFRRARARNGRLAWKRGVRAAKLKARAARVARRVRRRSA